MGWHRGELDFTDASLVDFSQLSFLLSCTILNLKVHCFVVIDFYDNLVDNTFLQSTSFLDLSLFLLEEIRQRIGEYKPVLFDIEKEKAAGSRRHRPRTCR